jgi:hypothetical protein
MVEVVEVLEQNTRRSLGHRMRGKVAGKGGRRFAGSSPASAFMASIVGPC